MNECGDILYNLIYRDDNVQHNQSYGSRGVLGGAELGSRAVQMLIADGWCAEADVLLDRSAQLFRMDLKHFFENYTVHGHSPFYMHGGIDPTSKIIIDTTSFLPAARG